MNKQAPVTNMTFGQLYDAVANGEEFYLNHHGVSMKIEIFDDSRLITQHNGAIYGQGTIKSALYGRQDYSVTSLTPWTDALDGTNKNGVWCKVWDDDEDDKQVIKIISFSSKAVFYKYIDIAHMNWIHAVPLSKEANDILNKEFNHTKTMEPE